MKGKKVLIVLLAANVAMLLASISVLASAATRILQPASPAAEARALDLPGAIALLAGAIAVAGSTLASGIALRGVATAGFAAAAEKPELTTWMLIMGGLAEGIAVYGLLLAILILGRI
ncbi:ATPase [Infirmifilum lucidum]|uniref:ATPase n=1 Tax=Infirmifilum lucidum TaxID=2776706 RepID=A0A7L9FF97_9CREN|nr:ATP synthase subunit C [Infirmifilum lucidum]QOJ78301.1 ATPase [Infirmifilum lucidum]